MKLATKGTLDAKVIIPKGVIMPTTVERFAINAFKSKLRLPEYIRAIMTKAKTPIVSAMPETLLNILPAT